MKPKLEKNIFIKRIIQNTAFLDQKKLKKSKIIKNTINNNFNSIKSKKCYIKPLPIFIISNLYKNNPFNIDLHDKNIPNFIYIKANNTERQQYFNIKKRIENKIKEKEIKDENKSERAKSYEINPFERILKKRKYFKDRYEIIKTEFNIGNLNTYGNNLTLNRGKYISNTNYIRYKFNTVNIMDEKNKMKNKSSKSTDIIKLCKVLNNLYNNGYDENNKGAFTKREDSNGGIINLNKLSIETQKRKNKYMINIKKIIIIQKWWKERLHKNYLKIRIILIQATFRGYIFRKNFLQLLYKLQKFSKCEYLNKIIFIQKFWKNYLTNNNQIRMSFSFTNNEDNNSNNKDIIYIENNNSSLKKELKQENNFLNYIIIDKKFTNHCFISKKYYFKYSSIISKINLIQKCFKDYLSIKQKNKNAINKYVQNIYQKKNLNNIKLKSRNKKIKTNSNIKQNNNYNFKSLIIVSPEKEFKEFVFHTPKKESTNKFKFEYNVIRDKEIKNIYNKQINDLCFISKKRKNKNLVKIIKFLQKYIRTKRRRKFFCFCLLKDINNICFIDKVYGNNIISNNLKCKIILLQINIRRFLKKNNNKQNSNLLNTKAVKNNKDILSLEKFHSTNEITGKKHEENSRNKNINLSEFSLKDKSNKDDENENFIISNNLNIFSFDLYNTKSENIDDDDYPTNIVEQDINNINKKINLSSKNMLINSEKNNSFRKLKLLFVSYITNKFAYFLTNIIKKLFLYNFIKLFMQKLNKNINQIVYYYICKKQEKKNEIIFFNTLKRHVKFNIKYDGNNEVKNLLIENIPKCFQISDDNITSLNIPFINSIQENKLINTQLFINNDEEMINYFNNFYIKEKGSFLLNNYNLKDILNKLNLKNRNIFTLTNYFDEIDELILNNKLCKNCLYFNEKCICNNNKNKSKLNYIKKKCNYIRMITKKMKENKENINDQFFNMFDEEDINLDEFNDENDFNFNRSFKNTHPIKIRSQRFNHLFTYHNEDSLNNQEYKFFDYLNEKCKNNNYNETCPLTHRNYLNSFRNKYNNFS